MDAKTRIQTMKWLCRDADQMISLILENLRVYQAKVIREWLMGMSMRTRSSICSRIYRSRNPTNLSMAD